MNKKILVIIAVVVILIVVGFMIVQSKKKQTEGPAKKIDQNNQQQSQEQVSGNFLEGTLKISNDQSRGNLMLELMNSDRIIYLRTSRDFSGLLNQLVAVQIEGTIDYFSLIDIQPQVPKVKEIKIN